MNSFVPDIEDHNVTCDVTADTARKVVRLAFQFCDERDPKLKATISLAIDTDEAIAIAGRILAAVDEIDGPNAPVVRDAVPRAKERE